MAFPYIDISQPYGSNFVSTVDDHERQTRRWLRDCVEEVTGYPNCPFVKIGKWDTENRPESPIRGVCGYNSDSKVFEWYNGSSWENLEINADVSLKDGQDNQIDTTYLKLSGGTLTGVVKDKMESVVRGTNPSSQQSYSPYRIVDNEENALSLINKVVKTDGETSTRLYDYDHQDGSANYIGVGHNGDGSVKTYAPTPATDDSSTQIATTRFVNNFVNNFIEESLVGQSQDNGYLKIGEYIIIQWGRFAPNGQGTATVTFPIEFNNKCYSVIANLESPNDNIDQCYSSAYDFSKEGFKIRTLSSSHIVCWIAIGK